METPTLLDLRDGRNIEVRTAGPEDGEIVVFHHGTPGAGLPFRPLVESAATRGLRIVTYSRPGYELSTPHRVGSSSMQLRTPRPSSMP